MLSIKFKKLCPEGHKNFLTVTELLIALEKLRRNQVNQNLHHQRMDTMLNEQ
jgi:hypothetical protein